jgi:hypothetical protein
MLVMRETEKKRPVLESVCSPTAQWLAADGEHSGCGFKVPNPFYFTR